MKTISANHKLHLDLTFATVEKLLYGLAWRYAAKYGMDFHEALSECHDAFMRAYYTRFDEDRGMEFSTFLQFLVECRFRTLMRRKRLREPSLVELEEELVGAAPEEQSASMRVVEEMSAAAQEFVNCLLQPAEELSRNVVTPRQLLAAAKKRFRDRGWSRAKVREVEEEVTTTLQLAWA